MEMYVIRVLSRGPLGIPLASWVTNVDERKGFQATRDIAEAHVTTRENCLEVCKKLMWPHGRLATIERLTVGELNRNELRRSLR